MAGIDGAETARQTPLRVVYFGTPEFAVPALRAFAADDRFLISLVVTQPDRPAGRGRRLERSAVGQEADALGLTLYQPVSLKTQELRQPLVDQQADLFVVAAFGLIFGPKTLAIPRYGCLNIHGSLLPRFRGASPVQCAVLAGDLSSGITVMKMDVGLDTGDVLATSTVTLAKDETSASLMEKLAALGGQLAPSTAFEFCAGNRMPISQAEDGVSVTRLITKADGWLDWNCPAEDLERRVRAMWPWPRAWTTAGNLPLQVHRASLAEGPEVGRPGETAVRNDQLVVQCNPGLLALETVQPAGKRPMDGTAFGRGFGSGLHLGTTGDPGAQPPVWSEIEA